MFVLLTQLNRLRRRIGLPRPGAPWIAGHTHVDAGSCNGCEHELGAVSGPHYDLARYGISIVGLAAPRRRPARHRAA